MISLDKFKVKVVKDDPGLGQIQIGPLPSGYGHTLGNTLRRILLSSVPGAAVTSVKIDGVKHEYTSMDNVQEDVIFVILKLKNLAIKKYSDDPTTLTLNVKGNKDKVTIVTANDFDVPSDVEIINKDLEITTLTGDTSLKLEVVVENGVGYSYADEERRKEIGVIPVDSNFSPVNRVDVNITKARLGEYTDLDQIDLDIYTNATVTASEALLKAGEIYDEMANRLLAQFGGDPILAEENIIKEEADHELTEDKILVSQLNLSTRLTNALLNSGISDLRGLAGLPREEVANFKGMGKKSMTELEDIMSDKGLTFEIN